MAAVDRVSIPVETVTDRTSPQLPQPKAYAAAADSVAFATDVFGDYRAVTHVGNTLPPIRAEIPTRLWLYIVSEQPSVQELPLESQ